MAEAIFKRMADKEGISSSLDITSRATSDCEEGNPVYPPAARLLKERGYNFSHRAAQLKLGDIVNADYLLCMDKMNYSAVTKLAGGNYSEKIFLLGDFLPERLIIDDPWYTGDFERSYAEITAACGAFLSYLKGRHAAVFAYDGAR